MVNIKRMGHNMPLECKHKVFMWEMLEWLMLSLLLGVLSGHAGVAKKASFSGKKAEPGLTSVAMWSATMVNQMYISAHYW